MQKLSFWNLPWFQGWLEIKVKFQELPWNQGCFQNEPEPFFEIKVDFNLESRSNFMSCLKIKVVFQKEPETPFSKYLVYVILIKQTKSSCLNVHFTSTWITKSVVQKFYNWFWKSSDSGFHCPCRNYDQKWWSLEILGLKKALIFGLCPKQKKFYLF